MHFFPKEMAGPACSALFDPLIHKLPPFPGGRSATEHKLPKLHGFFFSP